MSTFLIIRSFTEFQEYNEKLEIVDPNDNQEKLNIAIEYIEMISGYSHSPVVPPPEKVRWKKSFFFNGQEINQEFPFILNISHC